MDLVVVIATSTVLFTLLVSAHAKPRNRVYQTTDVSNQRRLLQAASSYAADHSDTLPNSGWGTSVINWACAANPPLGPAGSLASYQAVYGQQLLYVTNGQLFVYLQDSRVFMCPADRPDNSLFWQRSIYITSYTWNAAVNGYSSAGAYKLSLFRPDAILQWEQDDLTPFFWNDNSSFPDEGISLRHGTNLIFGMFGGGVGTATSTVWFSNSFAGGAGSRGDAIPASLLPNRLWCNPGKANGLP